MDQGWNDADEKKFGDLKQRWLESNRQEIEIATLMSDACRRDDVREIENLDSRLQHQRDTSEGLWDEYLPLLVRRSQPNDDNA